MPGLVAFDIGAKTPALPWRGVLRLLHIKQAATQRRMVLRIPGQQ